MWSPAGLSSVCGVCVSDSSRRGDENDDVDDDSGVSIGCGGGDCSTSSFYIHNFDHCCHRFKPKGIILIYDSDDNVLGEFYWWLR